MSRFVLLSLAATTGTWLVTAAGAATVLFFKTPKQKTLNILLGFASGVMIAASFWSLLEPAIERAEKVSLLPSYVVVTAGFLFGAWFMWFSDKAITLILKKAESDGMTKNERLNRIILLVLSITLHNIPEGLAVGVAFGSLQGENCSYENFMGAISVAFGIGLQNFPEGAAVSVPLRRDGIGRKKSFIIGQASGLVEPAAGVLGALLVVYMKYILPYALSFAAGAMILVAVHELIPECRKNENDDSYTSTMGIVSGFAVMMLLDVMLG